MPRDATDPNLVQDLRTAVEAVRHEVRAGRTDTLESLRTLSGDVRETRDLVIEHLGEHKGREKASGAHVAQGQAKVARWSALGTWARVVLVAVGMVAAAAAFVAFGSQALRAEQPTGIELRTEIKAAVRGEIKAAVADAFADMRDDEP